MGKFLEIFLFSILCLCANSQKSNQDSAEFNFVLFKKRPEASENEIFQEKLDKSKMPKYSFQDFLNRKENQDVIKNAEKQEDNQIPDFDYEESFEFGNQNLDYEILEIENDIFGFENEYFDEKLIRKDSAFGFWEKFINRIFQTPEEFKGKGFSKKFIILYNLLEFIKIIGNRLVLASSKTLEIMSLKDLQKEEDQICALNAYGMEFEQIEETLNIRQFLLRRIVPIIIHALSTNMEFWKVFDLIGQSIFCTSLTLQF